MAEARARRPSRRATRDTRLLVVLVNEVGVDPVLAALKVDPPHLVPMMEGRVGLSGSQRARLRALLEAAGVGPPPGPADPSSKSDTEVPF